MLTSSDTKHLLMDVVATWSKVNEAVELVGPAVTLPPAVPLEV